MSKVQREFNPYLFLSCPHDGLLLRHRMVSGGNGQFVCSNGHSFDVARQGYINLLSVNDKRSKDPGDTKDMVAARSRVLDAGLYLPIANALANTVKEQFLRLQKYHLPVTENDDFVLLDAGCGEGYYLQKCLDINAPLFGIKAMGLDISKWAIMAAAKRGISATLLVGSNRKPPIVEKSVDVIICGFGFPDFSAFRKLLRKNGCVIMLDPAAMHLIELRRIIYPSIKAFVPNPFSQAIAEGFKIIGQEALTYTLDHIHQQQIMDILTMSPHLYKASSEGKTAALSISSMPITMHVNFTVLTLSDIGSLETA